MHPRSYSPNIPENPQAVAAITDRTYGSRVNCHQQSQVFRKSGAADSGLRQLDGQMRCNFPGRHPYWVRLVVLLDGEDSDPLMPRYEGRQVWWVTSVEWAGDRINLCRYRLRPDARYPFTRHASPAKRLKLDRADWDARMLPESVVQKAFETAA